MPAFEEGAALKEQGECAENFEVHDPKNVGTFGVCGTLLYCAQILNEAFMSSLQCVLTFLSASLSPLFFVWGPWIVFCLHLLGNEAFKFGKMPEAIALYDRAVVILEKGDALGGGHVSHRKRVQIY